MTAPAVSSISPTGGPTAGGTLVTITGTTLTTPTAVTINSVNVTSFTGVSATSVTCVVPSAAVAGATAGTPVSIQVTTAGGTSSSSNGLFDYANQAFATHSGNAPAAVPDTKRSVRGLFSPPPSYTTGGYVLTPGLFGMTQVDEVIVGNSTTGVPATWVPGASGGAGKLRVNSAIGTQAAAGTDYSQTDSWFLVVYGK
jgi:hypothetical protein